MFVSSVGSIGKSFPIEAIKIFVVIDEISMVSSLNLAYILD